MLKTDYKKISVTAVLCALSYISVFLFRFSVSFLTFDFKDAFISIASLLYGPMYGLVSSFVVAFLELITVSDTAFYGFIMNFLSSAVFSVAIGFFYKYKRTFSGAILASVTAVLSMTAVMMLANIFITPYYMGVAVKDVIALLPTLLLPFNLSKAILNAAVLLIIYKPVTKALRKSKLLPETYSKTYKAGFKTVVLIAVSIILIILTVLFIILHLNGSFLLFSI